MSAGLEDLSHLGPAAVAERRDEDRGDAPEIEEDDEEEEEERAELDAREKGERRTEEERDGHGEDHEEPLRALKVVASVQLADHHVAVGEQAVHHVEGDLQDEQVEGKRGDGGRLMAQPEQRSDGDEEDDQTGGGKEGEEGEQQAEGAGLDGLRALYIAAVEEDGHLVVGVGLDAVVEGAEVVDRGAERDPLAVDLDAAWIEAEEEGRDQQLHDDGDALAEDARDQKLQDAPEVHGCEVRCGRRAVGVGIVSWVFQRAMDAGLEGSLGLSQGPVKRALPRR